MKRKPSGPKYRNLYARSGVIYYQRIIGAKRIHFSCETGDWNEAARVRELCEAKKGIGRVPAPVLEQAPRFHELAERDLETATHLAESTR